MAGEGKILVVDDEKAFRVPIVKRLVDEGFDVSAVEGPFVAIDRLRAEHFELVLSDLKMDGMSGIDLLKEIRAVSPELPVILVTGYASIDSAVEAIRRGAIDYLVKPCNNDELVIRIRRAIRENRKTRDLEILRGEVEQKYSFANIVGKNRLMAEIFRLIAQIAETDVTVLIRGETGTGKELVARAVHYKSPRKAKPFVAVNCTALSETLLESELFGHERGSFTGAIRQKLGRFEMAHGGTIFLDEIGDLPKETQTKLLRVLQEHAFERVGGSETIHTDIRVIAATHKNLEEAMAAGKFRNDLFYRLNVIPLDMPPLRERLDDIPLLVDHFIRQSAERLGRKPPKPTAGLLRQLMMHDWPGNVRELENVIERAMVLDAGETLGELTLPTGVGLREPSGGTVAGMDLADIDYPLPLLTRRIIDGLEREYLRKVLQRYEGSIQRSAEHARITRRSFFAKMRSYGIKKEEFKRKA